MVHVRLFIVALILASLAHGAPVPVSTLWPADAQPAASLAGTLETPAGKTGMVRAEGGHLVRGDGSRLRLWGVNVSGKGAIPEKTEATIIASHLARLGVNCVRFHFMDRPAPNGILANRNDTRALDPAMMDRLDFFIAELKQRGIYADLNLNVARSYKAGDGVRDHDLLGFAKAVTLFDPRIIELQKEYARQLLTHRNPYTGNEYRVEPAVAIVELLNENSLTEAWFGGRLIGKATQKNPGTWTDIPASYAEDLTKGYNLFLQHHLNTADQAAIRKEAGVAEGQPIPRLRPDEFAKASRLRFHAEAEFYITTERNFARDMGRFLREEVGVRPPLALNSDHGHWKTGYPQVLAANELDIIDGHVYWQHPRYLTGSEGRRAGFEIDNTPMVDNPLASSVAELSRSAVAGKPYTVSEVNHPFPNEYACEGIPILAAYAALHDWDGIFWYTLAHDRITAEPPLMGGHFDLWPDPVKMSQLAAGSLIFLRGDIAPARKTVERSLSHEQVIESIRMPTSERPHYVAGYPKAAPLVHGTRIRSLDGPPTAAFEAVPATSPITSDTGQLEWRCAGKGTGVVKIDSPCTQAIVGFVSAGNVAARNLSVELRTPFCAITLSSLDGRPISESSMLLMTVGSKVDYTDMKWNDKRTSLESWGKPPTRVEAVEGNVILRELKGAKAVRAHLLTTAGKAQGAVNSSRQESAWIVPLKQGIITYLVDIER